VVVIGGSSVMWGAAQSDEQLWSHELQRRLGDRYRVLNLALPSGAPQEHGGVAFQYLMNRGSKVIFLSDLGPSFSSPDGIVYPYVYWDAYYKGYLYPNPDAMPLIEERAKIRTNSPTLEELKLRSALDSALYFTDIWNAVGYNLFFTTWSYLVHPPDGYWFAPRAHFTDPQPGYPEEARYTQPPFDYAVSLIRGFVTIKCPISEDGVGSRSYASQYWREWEQQAQVTFPVAIRQNMIITRFLHARPYRDALSPEELRCYTALWDETDDRLHALGYGAMVLGRDWEPEDNIDVVHPSAKGGVKMATAIAAQVQDLAGRLGYLEAR